MKLKIRIEKQIADIHLERGKEYELAEDESIVHDCYKIKVPMKQAGKFRHVLVNENEGELVD